MTGAYEDSFTTQSKSAQHSHVYFDYHGYGVEGEDIEEILAGRCSYIKEFSYLVVAAPWRGEEGLQSHEQRRCGVDK